MSGIDYNVLAAARANAANAIAKAERLRVDLDEAEASCARWYKEIHRLIREGGGTAADHRTANFGLPWNFEAMKPRVPDTPGAEDKCF